MYSNLPTLLQKNIYSYNELIFATVSFINFAAVYLNTETQLYTEKQLLVLFVSHNESRHREWAMNRKPFIPISELMYDLERVSPTFCLSLQL